jgi:ribosomal-protein-alanine N-acetyltransferase
MDIDLSIQPQLTTDRLLLRPFVPGDAADVQKLASDWAIASTTLTIPHPYPDGAAEAWIESLTGTSERRESAVFAVRRRETDELLGAIGLRCEPDHGRGELGYWIGRPYWNRGFATEAARAVVDYAFGELALRRVFAHHLARNPASGRVLEKAAFEREGLLRQHVIRWGKAEDVVLWGRLNR